MKDTLIIDGIKYSLTKEQAIKLSELEAKFGEDLEKYCSEKEHPDGDTIVYLG